LQAKGIPPFMPGRKTRDEPLRSEERRFQRRSRMGIMLDRLTDGRRVAIRYDRCPTAVAIAATVIFQR
jgi:hypothetical protein